MKSLDIRNWEHIHALESATLSPDHSLMFWSSPPLGVIKLSVDAALTLSKASIAVVACNSEGFILKAWAKDFNSIDSLFAEAGAIVWALELDVAERFDKVIIESDAKGCVDDLECPPNEGCLQIRNFSSRSLELFTCFSSCNVQWVRREAN